MNTISRIANAAAYFFIITTFVLTVVSILGIWGDFDDVIGKSFLSIGLISFACLVILVIDGHYPKKTVSQEVAQAYLRSIENFAQIRKISFVVIIVSITVCVFLGLLSIWEILETDVFYKTMATMASIGFYSFITLIVCSRREDAVKSIKIETPTVSSPVVATVQTAPAQPVAPVTPIA